MVKYLLIVILLHGTWAKCQLTSLVWHGDTLYCTNPSTGVQVQVSKNPISFSSLLSKPSTMAALGVTLLTSDVPSIDLSSKTTGILPFSLGGIGASAATSATTGTMTVNMTTEMITITPTNACTFNASGGVAGQRVTFIVTTSGVSSFTLTWGTNYRTVGTLATGTTTAKKFCVSFVYDGSLWLETGRTAAM